MGFSSLFFLVGTCMQMLGVDLAIDTYAGVPWNGNANPEHNCYENPAGCTMRMIGGPIEYGPDQCYLPMYFENPAFDFVWCHDVDVDGPNGVIHTRTPCQTDTNLVANADMPFAVRRYWGRFLCPEWLEMLDACSPNACTLNDKNNDLCSCSMADEAQGFCDYRLDGPI